MYRNCFPFYAESCVESERLFSYFGKVSLKIRSSLKEETEVFPKSSQSNFFPKSSQITLKLIARLREVCMQCFWTLNLR
jgi:hypothetical protein